LVILEDVCDMLVYSGLLVAFTAKFDGLFGSGWLVEEGVVLKRGLVVVVVEIQ
jgi:hypothetical protein